MKRYATFIDYLEENYEGPFSATDAVIRHHDGKKDGIVLIERKYEPHGLALAGGIAEYMPFYKNAVKEAHEETGLELVLDNPDRPLCVLSELDQDPRFNIPGKRKFIASVTYTGRGYGSLKPHEDEDAKSAAVYTLDEIRKLLPQKNLWAFSHHRKILQIYLAAVDSGEMARIAKDVD